MKDNRRRFLKQLAGLGGIAGLSGVSPLARASVGAKARVTGIRLAKNNGYLRLVFDLDKSVQHSIFSLHDPERVVLDLKHVDMTHGLVDLVPANHLIRGIRSGIQNGNDLRVVFDLD
jgi:N-acetylmuramoyl-L-alanine amidase